MISAMLFVGACGGPAATTDSKQVGARPTPGTPVAGQQTHDHAVIGFQYDGSGPIAYIGTHLRDGAKDWNDYVNSNGGINGKPVEFLFEDNKYEAPYAVNIYKSWVNEQRIVALMALGTPIAEALIEPTARDAMPLLTPGFGLSDTVDGNRYPYAFVSVASYEAQAAAILLWIKDNWKEARAPQVAFMYFDNPAGRDPLSTIRKLAPTLGIKLVKEAAVPLNATDTLIQQKEIKAANPDFVITHLFGALPAASLKDRASLGIKTPYISFVWGISEVEIQAVGADAEGYQGVQFSSIAEDQPEAMEQIKRWYQAQGKALSSSFNSVFYARGVLIAALVHAAVAASGNSFSGESMKSALESLHDFKAFGMSPGTTLTSSDHGGSRKVRMYQVQGGKPKMIRDWFEGPTS